MLFIPLFPGCGETVVIFSLATRHAVCGRLDYESSYWMWSVWPVDSRGKCCTHQHVSHFYSAAGWSHVYFTECKTIFISFHKDLPLYCTIYAFVKTVHWRSEGQDTGFLTQDPLTSFCQSFQPFHMVFISRWKCWQCDWKLQKKLISGTRVGIVLSNYYLRCQEYIFMLNF